MARIETCSAAELARENAELRRRVDELESAIEESSEQYTRLWDRFQAIRAIAAMDDD